MPRKVIFAVNVDGIYKDPSGNEVIPLIDGKSSVNFSDVKFDVTGGMKRKFREALEISLKGIDVHIVNGLKPERILKTLGNKKTEGTVIKGKRSSTRNA
jgi:isopentenyl phosphate kinase